MTDMHGMDEWPPAKARTMEDWAEYWERQRWDRRARRRLRIRLAPWKRRLGAPGRWRRAGRAFLQRGQRGWAQRDVWSMDDYICRLLGEMTAEMRRVSHGYPCACEHAPGPDGIYRPPETCTCAEDWNATLDAISGPLLGYRLHWEWPDGQEPAEHRDAEVRAIAEAQDALRLLAENLPGMWD